MNDFFKKNKVYVLTTLNLFDFVTDIGIENVENHMNNLLKEAQDGYSEETL